MSDFSSEAGEASALGEARRIVRGLARPFAPGEGIKGALRRAARRLPGFSPNRVRDLWYADRRCRVGGDELAALRAAARTGQAGGQDDGGGGHGGLEQRLRRLERELADLRARLRGGGA